MKKCAIGFMAALLVFTPVSCEMDGDDEEPVMGNVPTGVTARTQSSTTIYICWTGIINADYYTVYRVSDAGSQQFEIHNAFDYTDTKLKADTLYSYQVSATKGGVEGAKSQTVPAKTFPDGTVPAPGQVTGVTTRVSGSTVTITWTAVSDAASYTLERGTDSSGPWSPVYTGTLTTRLDSGLQAGTYYYHAAASNASGLGPWSASAIAVITGGSGPNPDPAPDPKPDPAPNPNPEPDPNPDPNPDPEPVPKPPTAVSNPTVTGTTKNSATISWSAVEGAASYKVYRSDSETGIYSETKAGTFSGTSFTNTGLSPEKDYWYKVAGINAGGAGPLSGIPAKATTAANIGVVPGEYITLAQKLEWIGGQYDDTAVYDITVNADETLPATTVRTSGRKVTINIHSSAEDIKTLSLSGTGNLFLVSNSITLKLENIKLLGNDGNTASLVKVTSGGTLILDTGSEITGNTVSSYGGGIYVDGGTLTIYGGKITGNTASSSSSSPYGGGIYMNGGTFTMYGGEITGNTVSSSSYRSDSYGGGIYMNGGTFTMYDGEITGNTASSSYSRYGGGVCVDSNGRFTMHGGIISKNNGASAGGGVYIASGYFAKTPPAAGEPSGIIYGNDVGADLANIASNYNPGYVTGGIAVYNRNNNKRRETTLNGFDEISTDNANTGWEK